MIDVGKVAKQVDKLCSDSRANSDANVGSVNDTISSPPAPSANVTDYAAASHAKSVAADVFLPSTFYIPSTTVVITIDSTAAAPPIDPPYNTSSISDAYSTATTSSIRPSPMDAVPVADMPLPAASRSDANPTAILHFLLPMTLQPTKIRRSSKFSE